MLLDAGHDVLGLDSLAPNHGPGVKLRNLDTLRGPGFEFVRGDLTELQLEPILANGVDVVFHLAGQPGVRTSWGPRFGDYLGDNVLATQHVLEAIAASTSPPRLVFASSSSVYGDGAEHPRDERSPTNPSSPYGVSKLAAEKLVELYPRNHPSMSATSLRLFTVYGPGQRPDMAFSRFFRSVRAGQEIVVFGDGSQVREFTFVDDVARAFALAAVADGPLPAIVNIAGGSRVTLNEALAVIADVVGEAPRVRFENAVAGDVRYTGGTTDLARTAFGWEPTTTLRAGLEAQWAAFTDSALQ